MLRLSFIESPSLSLSPASFFVVVADMRPITVLSAVVAATVSGALAQTTVNIIQPDFLEPDDVLQGEIVGVGAEGTTYVVTNVISDTEDLPYTGMFSNYS